MCCDPVVPHQGIHPAGKCICLYQKPCSRMFLETPFVKSPKLEITQKSINNEMNKKTVVWSHNETLYRMRTSDLQLPRVVWMKFKPQCWTQESRHRGSGPILCAHYLRLTPTVWWDLYKIQTQANRTHAVLGQDSDNLWWVEAEGDLVEVNMLWFLFWVLVTWLGSVLENSLNPSFITCALFCMYLTFLKAKLWWFWTVVLMLLNYGVGEDSWESLGQQGDPTNQRKSVLNIRWKDWCWSWSSLTLATW